MILMLFLYQMHRANCEYQLTAKWKSFVEKHIIADDPYDEETKFWRDLKDKEDKTDEGDD